MTIPGSGFAQTFIGMDAVIVRFLARKAKKMANKWGGQCIVFIDEIDAVGMRRASLGSRLHAARDAARSTTRTSSAAMGALTSTGDLVMETAAWREKLFAMRAEPRAPALPGDLHAARRARSATS